MTDPQEFTLTYQKKEQLSIDAYAFYFNRLDQPSFDFLPGHYIRITLSIPQPDERGNSRYFSLTTSPLNKLYIRITTRIIQSSFKKTLLNLPIGTKVKFFGPAGRFIFQEEEIVPHVFLAGGIGITPYLSMVEYARDQRLQIPITLFVSVSHTEDIIYYDHLMKISQENPSIKIVYTITKPEESKSPWTGETGRISADLIKKYVPDLSNTLFYISGPQKMVEALNETVIQMGISTDKIRKENFPGY